MIARFMLTQARYIAHFRAYSRALSWTLSLVLSAWPPLSPAYATSFFQIPFPQAVSDAPAIVRGTVGNSYSDWGKGADSSKRLYTFTELQIAEVFKGSIGGSRTLIMRELGGSKDGMGMEVPGSAKFSRGEDVVAFLGDTNSDSSRDVRGLMMGKYMVERDPQGNEFLSGPGLGVVGGDEHIVHGSEETTGQADTTRWTIDALRQLVRSQAKNTDVNSQQMRPGNATPKPTFSRDVLPAPVAIIASGPSAPQLQPSPVGEGSGTSSNIPKPWLPWVLAGLALLGLTAIIRDRIRKR